ncbi:uncharacterized protein JNUCC1_02299 [Lentibacillus sp. JNUCC-1]|uniref:TraR/DksA C4-type zinc finger protein n=1 Tax=Lentibacillus sp. JNUCC-1 TaxID=2654513 RepID=UPI0012E91092|nr:TraR/DksA C4-type zinc finger protein [Lentibacillus sp. JNUCC-1]MUV38461.1 uncharacterized protein [Lentibacillus sp. JNUCC-1]
MLTKEQLTESKQRLQKRKKELQEQLEDHFGKPYEQNKETTGELSNYDNHPGDHGTELFEQQKDLALNEHAETELEQIDEALQAIDKGTYGVCAVCGKDIPYERLEAVPTALTCVDHAGDTIYESSRPVEEEVISPNINPEIEEEQVEYDAEDAWQEVARYGTSETPSDFYEDKEDYDEMYPNSDEETGGTENPEEFLSSDIEGDYSGVTPNHKKYEEDYDKHR